MYSVLFSLWIGLMATGLFVAGYCKGRADAEAQSQRAWWEFEGEQFRKERDS